MKKDLKEIDEFEIPNELSASPDEEFTSLNIASRKMAALVTLDRAKSQPLFEQKMEDLLIDVRKDERVREGELDSIPMLMENPDFVSEHHESISRIFPDVWKQVYDPSELDKSGKGLLAEAGHKGLAKKKGVGELNQFVGMLDTYNKQFGSEGSTLAHLKSPESSKWIKNGLKGASWGVSFITGGIYVKAGIAATGYLVGKLGANEKVQALGRELGDKAYASVSKLTGRSEADLRAKAEGAKASVQKVTSKKWFVLGAAVAMAGVALLAFGDIKTDFSSALADPLPDGTSGSGSESGAKITGQQRDDMFKLLTANREIDLEPTETLTVKSGDSLWKIAEAHLEQSGAQASNKEISDLVDKIYADNKDVIGSNRDLIQAGQELKIDLSPTPSPENIVNSLPFRPDIKMPAIDYGLSNNDGLINEKSLDQAEEAVQTPTVGKFNFNLTNTAGLVGESRIDAILNEGMNPKEKGIDATSLKYKADDEPSIG